MLSSTMRHAAMHLLSSLLWRHITFQHHAMLVLKYTSLCIDVLLFLGWYDWFEIWPGILEASYLVTHGRYVCMYVCMHVCMLMLCRCFINYDDVCDTSIILFSYQCLQVYCFIFEWYCERMPLTHLPRTSTFSAVNAPCTYSRQWSMQLTSMLRSYTITP